MVFSRRNCQESLSSVRRTCVHRAPASPDRALVTVHLYRSSPSAPLAPITGDNVVLDTLFADWTIWVSLLKRGALKCTAAQQEVPEATGHNVWHVSIGSYFQIPVIHVAACRCGI